MLPGKRSEPCKVCNKPVYILERLNVSGRLLHRTCFKCARCHHQLSIANYYETESGAYCCEMCPDEEVIQTEVAEANKKAVKVHAESSEDEECSLPECQQQANNNNNNTEPVDQENNTVEDVEHLSDVIVKAVEEVNIEDVKCEETMGEVQKDEQIPECDQEVKRDNLAAVSDDKEEADMVQIDDEKKELDQTEQDAASPGEILNVDDHNNVEKEVITDDHENEKKEEIVDEIDKNDENGDEHLEIKVIDTLQDNQIEELAVPEPAKVVQDQESYPEDLNPFGDNEDLVEELIKESTNPFGSESDEGEDGHDIVSGAAPTLSAAPPKPPRLSLNPFGSDFEDSDGEKEIKVTKRKKRHAPQPPGPPTPTPAPRASLRPPRPPPPKGGKSQKDQDNLNRRSQILEAADQEEPVITLTPLSPDKSSMDGKWKKKKGPAPPRPIPPKRQVKKLPRKAVNTELLDIEVKQQELERQGVELEKTIRELCEKSDKERAEAGLDNNDRDSLGLEAEDLIVQLFELVNEKNELFRRQTELMYMKREHRLEEEHADIEHQVIFIFVSGTAMNQLTSFSL